MSAVAASIVASRGRHGYRRLLKTAKYVFKGDSFAISQAKITLRQEFLKHKHVTDTHELQELLRGIDEVDEMLKFNIVQGKLNERGNYGVFLFDIDFDFDVTINEVAYFMCVSFSSCGISRREFGYGGCESRNSQSTWCDG